MWIVSGECVPKCRNFIREIGPRLHVYHPKSFLFSALSVIGAGAVLAEVVLILIALGGGAGGQSKAKDFFHFQFMFLTF